jgi:hypothetical protein
MTRARSVSKLGNPSAFTVDIDNNIGVNSTSPKEKLNVVGIVSATSFFGDGSSLSGITAGATLSAGSGDQKVVLTSKTSGQVMTTAGIDAELNYNSGTNTLSATTFSGALTGNADSATTATTATTATNAQGLTGTPDITVRNVTGVAATFSGDVKVGGVLTYDDVTNVDSVGLITARSGIKIGPIAGVGGTFAADGSYITAGIITAGSYRGDGSLLTGISAGGIATAAGTAAGIVTTLFLSSAQDHKITASGITTITVSGGTESESHTVRIINSGITTVGFSTFFLFPSGSTPSLPTADGAISLISFTVNRVGAGGTQLLAGASVNYS